MTARRHIGALVPLVALLSSFQLAAEDWPQWRGPSSLGISAENGLPQRWSAAENVAWKAKLAGSGASSPVVTGGLVVVTSQIGSYRASSSGDPLLARDDQSLAAREQAISTPPMASGNRGGELFLAVEAFRASDGRRLWEYRIRAAGELPKLHEKHNLATPTPVSDGERIYAWFGNGQLVALDVQGRELWRHHLGQEYGSFLTPWGHGSSPVLYKDLLILLCDHQPVSYLLAIDKRTGERRWKVDQKGDRVSHSTPVVVPGPQGDELIVNSSARIEAYAPATGNLLWHAGGERQTPIPSAVFHDGAIYLSRGYRNSDVLAIRAGGARRRHGDSRAVANSQRGFLCALDPALPGVDLHDQRSGRGDLRRSRHRGAVMAQPPGRHLLRIAGRGRRQGLPGKRNRGDIRAARRTESGGSGQKPARRTLPGLAGDFGRQDLPARRQHFVRRGCDPEMTHRG